MYVSKLNTLTQYSVQYSILQDWTPYITGNSSDTESLESELQQSKDSENQFAWKLLFEGASSSIRKINWVCVDYDLWFEF